MHISVIRDPEGLARLKEEWQALLDRCKPNYVFMTWQWLSTWWSHFGRGRELFVLAVRDGSELIGIVPLALFTHAAGLASKIRYLHFVGYRSGKRITDYMDIIAVRKEEVLDAVFGYLRKCQHLWDTVDLWDLLEGSETISVLSSIAARTGFPAADDEMTKALWLPTDSDWESYYKSRIKDRREFERRLRRLQEKGEFKVAEVEAAEIPAFVDTLFEFYGRRWDESSASLAPYRDFFCSLLQTVPPDWLNCSTLQVDGKPIAAQISLRYGLKLFHLMTAYDPDFADFSPGRVQLRYLLEGCFRDAQILECYFGRGTEPYKYEWATGECAVHRVQLSNAYMAGHIGRVLRRVPPSVRRPLIAAHDAVNRLPRGRSARGAG